MVRVTRNLTRKSMALLTSLLLVLFWVPGLIAASPAHAAALTTIPGSPYNGSNGILDTSTATAPVTTVADAAGNFTNGADENAQCPGVTTSDQLASPKDDLTTFSYGTANGTTNTTSSNVYLYLAWQRAATSGTTTIDFELNQATGFKPNCNGVNPQRATGDILFTFDFQANGTNVTINYFTWNSALNNGTGAWVDHGEITGLTDPVGNPVVQVPVVEGQTNATGSFGEMAINLSSPTLGIFNGVSCTDFGQVWPKTRSSSQNLSNELKDFIQPTPAVISNCAPIQILKEDSGTTPLAGATFSITSNTGTHALPPGQGFCATRSDGFCY